MARTKRDIIVNADGTETDGMATWGGPNLPYDSAMLQKCQDNLADTAAERIANLRHSLSKSIRPFLCGPISREEIVSSDKPGTRCHLKLAHESGCYIVSPDAPPAVENAIDALNEIRSIEQILERDSDPDHLVNSAVDLGVLCERFQLRMEFAEYALHGAEIKIRRPAAMRDRKAKQAHAKKRSNRALAEAAMKWAREKHPTAAFDDNMRVLLPAAAKQLEKSVSTLKRWLRIPK